LTYGVPGCNLGPMPEKSQAAPVDAGFAAESLDSTIQAGIVTLGKCVGDVEHVRSTLERPLAAVRVRLNRMLQQPEGSVPDATVFAACENLIEWLEKYARTSLNLAKLVDETARLRSFVSGGADSRPDIANLSDAALAEIVLSAAEKAKKRQ